MTEAKQTSLIERLRNCPSAEAADTLAAYEWQVSELTFALESLRSDLRHVRRAIATEPKSAKAIVETMEASADEALASAKLFKEQVTHPTNRNPS